MTACISLYYTHKPNTSLRKTTCVILKTVIVTVSYANVHKRVKPNSISFLSSSLLPFLTSRVVFEENILYQVYIWMVIRSGKIVKYFLWCTAIACVFAWLVYGSCDIYNIKPSCPRKSFYLPLLVCIVALSFCITIYRVETTSHIRSQEQQQWQKLKRSWSNNFSNTNMDYITHAHSTSYMRQRQRYHGNGT